MTLPEDSKREEGRGFHRAKAAHGPQFDHDGVASSQRGGFKFEREVKMAFINRGSASEAKTVEFPGPVRAPVAAVPPPLGASHTSIISSDLSIVGQQITIITKGSLQVDGEVCADVHGKEIIIGETGKVTGTVVGERVCVKGEVNGAVRGVKVELQSKARVQGEVHHQTLAIAEGAHFDGRVRRPQDTKELMPILDPTAHSQRASPGM